MNHYKSINEMRLSNGVPPSEHPLLSVYRCTDNCTFGAVAFTGDFYAIGFKKLRSGVFRYGLTQYDHANGSMSFMRPRQVIQFRDLEFEEEGFLLFFHEDYLDGHPLHAAIRKYGFFDYEVNEALHLSPKEEQTIKELYEKIETEYHNNEDEYSRDIILAHIDSILKYAQRFYKRQFLHRAPLVGAMVSKFNETLSEYVAGGQLTGDGLPTVSLLAQRLHLSPRYMSDLLKQETGKTAIELIHLFLIGEAKNLLRGEGQSVSEIAYGLGFENLPYFSRLFKREVGVSPNQYKRQLLN